MLDNVPIEPSEHHNKVDIAVDNINGLLYPVYKDIGLVAAEGKDSNHRIVNKFGSSLIVDDSGFSVISQSGTYQVPTSAQSLEFVSDNVGDALNGIGLWEITIEGLGANWELQTKVMAAHVTDGTIAVAIDGTWLRIFRAHISASGAYATLTTPSHIGNITIRSAGAGVVWAKIINTDISHGQTQIGAYTVPAGETAYIGETVVHTESNKSINVFGFKREGANIVTPPFNTMRIFTKIINIEGSQPVSKKSWQGPFPAYTDIGYLAKRASAGIASASIDFEILLVKDSI